MVHELHPLAAAVPQEFSGTLTNYRYILTFRNDMLRLVCSTALADQVHSLRREHVRLYTAGTVAELFREAAGLPADLDATRSTVVLGNKPLEEGLRSMIKILAQTCAPLIKHYEDEPDWDATIFEQCVKACGATLGTLAAEQVEQELTERRWLKPV